MATEVYRFDTLKALESAAKKAFGSLDHSNCHFIKGLGLEFTTTDSVMFDQMVRDTLKTYGGQLVPVNHN